MKQLSYKVQNRNGLKQIVFLTFFAFSMAMGNQDSLVQTEPKEPKTPESKSKSQANNIKSQDKCPQNLIVKLLVPDHPFSPRYTMMRVDSLQQKALMDSLQFGRLRMGYECHADGFQPWIKVEWQVLVEYGNAESEAQCDHVPPDKHSGSMDLMVLKDKKWVVLPTVQNCVQFGLDDKTWSMLEGAISNQIEMSVQKPEDGSPAKSLPAPKERLGEFDDEFSDRLKDFDPKAKKDKVKEDFGDASWE